MPAVHHEVGADPPPILQALASRPERTAVLTDFDGTLALIDADPEAVWPLEGVADLLAELARRFGRVGLVSGRPAAFLLSRLVGRDGEPPSGVALAGLYGLEVVEGRDILVHPDALSWVPAVDGVVAAAEAGAPPGVGIERKGLSVTLHVRAVPHEAHWAQTFAAAHADATGLSVHLGRMSWELRPPVDVDKGTTIATLLDGMDGACFMGDDVGDLPAFDALDDFARGGGHAVRVAVRSAEAPPDLVKRADLVVDGPHGALDLLRWLAQSGQAAAAT